MLPRASVSANRIMEVIETEPSIKDKEETQEAPQYRETLKRQAECELRDTFLKELQVRR